MARPGAAAPAGGDELVVTDLLLDLDELCRHLAGRLAGRDAVDAFLLAAGINQVVEDHLHRDPLSLARVEKILRGRGGLRAALGGAAWAIRRSALAWRELSPSERRLRRCQRRLARLVDTLAAAVLGGAAAWPELEGEWSRIDRGLRRPPRLRSSVLRLPSCFRDLDQCPEDMWRLAALVADALPDGRPVLVVGLRTSGSYLGPLLAAALRSGGRRAVMRTLRPGAPLMGGERRELARLARAGFCTVLVDDPPSSGRALVRGAGALQTAGFARHDVLVAVAALDTTLPAALAGLRCVALGFEQWAIHRALDEESVHGLLAELLPGQDVGAFGRSARVVSVLEVTRTAGRPQSGERSHRPRRHSEGVYAVSVLTPDGPRRLVVHAEGAGLGYLGRQSLAIAAALGPRLPRHYGLRGGLLFREWVEHTPSFQAHHPARTEELVGAIAGYVRDRAAALPAARDRSLQLGGRNPVWQRVADLLAEPYGRLRPLARWPLHRLARCLLRVESAIVVDGDMTSGRWFVSPGPDGQARDVKIAADGAAFSNEDLACYDPVFDLAAAEASLRAELQGEPAPGRLREAAPGSTRERWLLYQLERLSAGRREIAEGWADGACEEGETALGTAAHDAARERVHAEYLAAALGPPPPSGATRGTCAVDIDGVLEGGAFGYSATTPLGLSALRSMAAHGYAPVLATGRHLADVRWRCATYGLSAAVAEYGCVVYLAEGARVIDVLDVGQRRLMAEVTRRLRSGGVLLDPDFRSAIRSFRLDGQAVRRAPEPASLSRLLGDLASSVTVISGWSQADIVPRGVDKGVGLGVLLTLMGRPPAAIDRPLAMAIGDSASDLPMLRMARLACAPANSAPQLREGGARVLRQPAQRGLAAAAGLLVGHSPGGCRLCAAPPPAPESRLLLRALGAPGLAAHRRALAMLRLLVETRA